MFACWCLICRRRADKVSPKQCHQTVLNSSTSSVVSEESGSICKPLTGGLGVTGEGIADILDESTFCKTPKGKSIEESHSDFKPSFRTIEEYH
jgi:hypothetical protein